jgi:hypothetical protein
MLFERQARPRALMVEYKALPSGSFLYKMGMSSYDVLGLSFRTKSLKNHQAAPSLEYIFRAGGTGCFLVELGITKFFSVASVPLIDVDELDKLLLD